MFGGYVIPRRVADDIVVPVVHGGHDGNNTVGSVVRGGLSRTYSAVDDYGSRHQFKTRCIYCKNFHAEHLYCFRLRKFGIMPKSRKRDRSRSRSRRSRSRSRGSEDFPPVRRKFPPVRRNDMEEEGSDDSSDDTDSSDDGSGVEDGELVDLMFDNHGPRLDTKQLDKFYSVRKRIDAHEETLVIQAPTVQMYFKELLAHGRLDKDSSKKLRKKYYLGEKNYKALAPPTLSDTKLHMIQSREAGGIFNRFLTIHIHHRDALKLFLRSYELLAGSATVYEGYESISPYQDDTIGDDFVLPTYQVVEDGVSEHEVEKLLPVGNDGVVHDDRLREITKQNITLTRLVERQAASYVKVLGMLQKATDVAVVGVSLHGALTDLLFDGLQLYAQTDLAIKEAREARVEEYLTPAFKTALKAANRDKSDRTDKHVQDKLLYRDIDKLVKEEAKTNSKVSYLNMVFLFFSIVYSR